MKFLSSIHRLNSRVCALCVASTAWILSGSTANAITFNLAASIGGDSSVYNSGMIGFLVADTDGTPGLNIFDSWLSSMDSSMLIGVSSQSTNTLLGSDGLIVGALMGGNVVDFGGGNFGYNLGNTFYDTTTFTAATWSAGDDLWLVSFPDGSSDVGDRFQAFHTSFADLGSGGTLGMITPADGATDSIVALGQAMGIPAAQGYSTTEFAGSPIFDLSNTPSMGTKGAPPQPFTGFSGLIIPEPSAAFLIGAAGLGFIVRRRR